MKEIAKERKEKRYIYGSVLTSRSKDSKQCQISEYDTKPTPCSYVSKPPGNHKYTPTKT